jgi:hypothetical protein
MHMRRRALFNTLTAPRLLCSSFVRRITMDAFPA